MEWLAVSTHCEEWEPLTRLYAALATAGGDFGIRIGDKLAPAGVAIAAIDAGLPVHWSDSPANNPKKAAVNLVRDAVRLVVLLGSTVEQMAAAESPLHTFLTPWEQALLGISENHRVPYTVLAKNGDKVLEVLAEDYERQDEQREAYRALKKTWDVGRNDPCPCGSGLKFKRCHAGAVETEETDNDGVQEDE